MDNDNCKKKIENFKSYNYLNCIRDINNNRLFYLAGDSFGEHFLNVLTFSDKKIIENIYLSKVENENFLPNNTLNIQSINNFKKISKNYKDKYFIFSISYRNETKKESLVKFFQNLKNFNVIIIRPHQRSNKNVKECFTKQKILNEKIEEKNCLYEKKFDQARINRINLILDELKLSYNNIKLFDFNELICIDEQCKIYNKDEDLILFTDNTHLTVEASKLISLHFQNWLINEYNNSF